VIKAVLAVRNHSQATGPRRAVLAVLATYADQDGNNAFPKWETLAEQSGVCRRTVANAIKEALKAGEIECTGQRKSKTKIYSFAPLIHSAPSAPCTQCTPIVHPLHPDGAPSAPDQAVIKQEQKRNKNIPRNATLAGNTGPSVLDASKNNGKAPVDTQEVQVAQKRHRKEERQRLESEISILSTQQKRKPSERTERAIQELRAQLALHANLASRR
jgi:hypothetical protein